MSVFPFSRHIGMNYIRMAHDSHENPCCDYLWSTFPHRGCTCTNENILGSLCTLLTILLYYEKTCAIALTLIELNFKVQKLTYHDDMYHYNKFTLPALVQVLLISCSVTYWDSDSPSVVSHGVRLLQVWRMRWSWMKQWTFHWQKRKHRCHFWQDFLADEASLCNR